MWGPVLGSSLSIAAILTVHASIESFRRIYVVGG